MSAWIHMASAASGDSVWVYNRLDDTVSEVDAGTSEVRQTTPVSAIPVDHSLLAGPVLAADEDGAWIVGLDGRGRPVLTRVLTGAPTPRDYFLDREPRAVVADEGAVWVLGAGRRDNQVLRVDPTTGEVTARARFPASARLSSLGVGLGRVWAMSSSTAVLYRIDPRSAAVTGRVDLGQRASRPSIEPGVIAVGVSPSGTLTVDPRTLEVVTWQGCCDLAEGYDTVFGHGSEWGYDWDSGTVNRFAFNRVTGYSLDEAIAVTEPPRYNGGPCITSIATTADAVWVTLGYSTNSACSR